MKKNKKIQFILSSIISASPLLFTIACKSNDYDNSNPKNKLTESLKNINDDKLNDFINEFTSSYPTKLKPDEYKKLNNNFVKLVETFILLNENVETFKNVYQLGLINDDFYNLKIWLETLVNNKITNYTFINDSLEINLNKINDYINKLKTWNNDKQLFYKLNFEEKFDKINNNSLANLKNEILKYYDTLEINNDEEYINLQNNIFSFIARENKYLNKLNEEQKKIKINEIENNLSHLLNKKEIDIQYFENYLDYKLKLNSINSEAEELNIRYKTELIEQISKLNYKKTLNFINAIKENYIYFDSEEEYQNFNKKIIQILNNISEYWKFKEENNINLYNEEINNKEALLVNDILENKDISLFELNKNLNEYYLISNDMLNLVKINQEITIKNNEYKNKIIKYLSHFNDENMNILKNRIVNEYPFLNNEQYILFNYNIDRLFNIISKYNKLEVIEPLEGVVINKNSEMLTFEEYLNKILNQSTIDLKTIFSDDSLEKIEKLYDFKVKYYEQVKKHNLTISDYIHSLENYSFNQNVVKDIYLKNKSIYYNNPNQKNQFIEKLIKLNDNINILESLINDYSLDNLFKEEFTNVINLEKNNYNSSNALKLIEKIKNYIKNNSLANESINLEQEKNKIIDLISNSQLLSNEEKELFKEQINNSYIKYEFDLRKNNIDNYLNKYQLKLEEILNQTNIKQSIKDDLHLFIKSVRTKEQYQQYFEYFKNLKNKLEELKNEINSFKEKIKSKEINNLKEFNFYKLLSDKRRLYKNELKSFDILNFDSSISEINSFILEIQKINNSNYENDNISALDLLKNIADENFTLENYENENRYQLDTFKTPGSFNLKTAKLFFDHFDDKTYNYTINNIKIVGNQLNQLELSVTLKFKGVEEFTYNFTKVKTFEKGIINDLNDIEYVYIDEIFDLDYDSFNSYTKDEFQNLKAAKVNNFIKPLYSGIGKYFKYQINDLNLDEFNVLNGYLNITFNNQILKTVKLKSNKNINFRKDNITQQEYWDQLNYSKIMEIIKSNSKEAFFNNLTLKDPNNRWNHTDHIASEAKEALEKYYNMPKFGNYEIYIAQIENINNWNRSADFKLWYKKDGKEQPLPLSGLVNKFTINNFMFLNYENIKPKKDIFANSDFNSTEYSSIGDDDKQIIDNINESNFSWRKTLAAMKDGRNEPAKYYYRGINVANLVEQKAFIKLNYFFEITHRDADKRKGINLDKQQFLPLSSDKSLYDLDIAPYLDNRINNINSNYFYYFYDVQQEGNRGMSFKLGWINKHNSNKRYTNNKTYHLINIVNDYEQAIYPEMILNNIKLSDIIINKDELNKRNFSYWNTHRKELFNLITFKGEDSNRNLIYRNYKLNWNNFYISSVKELNNQMYIKLGVNSFTFDSDSTKKIESHIWYKISDNENTKYLDKLLDNSNLSVIYQSTNEVIRRRIIEPYWRDLEWKINTEENNAYWYLDKKYIDKTLLKPNIKKANIKFNIRANILYNDNLKEDRIRGNNKTFNWNTYNYNIDFLELMKNKIIEFDKSIEVDNSEFQNDSKFKYKVIFIWDELKGIKVVIQTENRDYKIVIDEPETQLFEENVKFDSNRSMLILPNSSKITIEYWNDEENEDFNVDSNKFNYNDIFFTEENQPILISNDPEFLFNKSVYYPNQNVPYKFHEGYLMNQDSLNWNKQKDWEFSKNTWLRSVQVVASRWTGSTSIIGKVNNDPHDYRFYLATNRHVYNGGVHNFDKILNIENVEVEKPFNLVVAPKYNKSSVNKYYDVLSNNHPDSVKPSVQLIWTAVDQKAEKGWEEYDKNKNITDKINSFYWLGKYKPSTSDLSIFIADFNNVYKDAKSNGQFNLIYKLDQLANIGGVKLDFDNSKDRITVPFVRDIGIIGYPGMKMMGLIYRRQEIYKSWYEKNLEDIYVKITQKENDNPAYLGGGGSGSGMYVDNDTYIATWASGWKGYYTFGIKYKSKFVNYFGINNKSNNPFDSNNTNSFYAQILRANLSDPNKFSEPWFTKLDFIDEDNE
ncbi:MGA_1079 family surface serine endopeptidase [Mycoplasma sp. OR1901]|uniref:MGA_1079 family surface serine endopeptidase n=1 Tax=Mycoplasma sp. OR1901 TaxID=2742195 RepID=UPI001583D7EA|nr:hypothetical protein [Mycoplasma sp. OR1901]QKT05458.1 hypothetical protein HTZ87_01940 [Mycoplasma sp. OR1901]